MRKRPSSFKEYLFQATSNINITEPHIKLSIVFTVKITIVIRLLLSPKTNELKTSTFYSLFKLNTVPSYNWFGRKPSKKNDIFYLNIEPRRYGKLSQYWLGFFSVKLNCLTAKIRLYIKLKLLKSSI